MSSQCYIMKVNGLGAPTVSLVNNDAKPALPKEKIMSYEEKTVGSTPFFKCEACPFMALAEDDIKFHLFTVHPDLAKTNGLADHIQIPCPGCTSIFDAEETLRNHLRNHHKMGIKDVKKMVKSLVQIALKDAKLKKEEKVCDPPPPVQLRQDIGDVKIPQVIEIGPDVVNANTESLPKGVAFISVDELHKMSTPNFEKVDPKEIIQEANINIVYTNEVSAQYVNVSNAGMSNSSCNIIQVSSVTPDLISSIKPRMPALDNSNSSPQTVENNLDAKSLALPARKAPGRPLGAVSCSYDEKEVSSDNKETPDKQCLVDKCHFKMKNDDKLAYHRKCHQNGKLHCPECSKLLPSIDALHTHLWKTHEIDMELPTCEICGFKTYKKYRLYNIHMKSHGKIKAYSCKFLFSFFHLKYIKLIHSLLWQSRIVCIMYMYQDIILRAREID